jgi:AraC-like DNA-binding protein
LPFSRPTGLLAGYHSHQPVAEIPEIEIFGEQWAPRNFKIGLHTHDIWELYLQLKGGTVWEASGREYRVAANGLLAVPPGVVHQLILTPDSRHHFYYCGVDVGRVLADRPELLSNWPGDRIILRHRAQSLVASFRTLAREITLDLPYRAVGARSALDQLLIEASRLIVASEPAPALLAQHPAVMHARDLIDMQPEYNWSLSELAARSNVSPSHLGERFRTEVGVPPRQYLLQARLNRALELLSEGDLSITQIALDLGFSSSQHMAAMIKKRTGKSPSEHRKR